MNLKKGKKNERMQSIVSVSREREQISPSTIKLQVPISIIGRIDHQEFKGEYYFASSFRIRTKKKKYFERYVKYHTNDEIQIYESEEKSNGEPLEKYKCIPKKSTFKRRKKHTISVDCFNFEKRKKIKVYIRCINQIELSELVQVLRIRGILENTIEEKNSMSLFQSIMTMDATTTVIKKKIEDYSFYDVLKWSSFVVISFHVDGFCDNCRRRCYSKIFECEECSSFHLCRRCYVKNRDCHQNSHKFKMSVIDDTKDTKWSVISLKDKALSVIKQEKINGMMLSKTSIMDLWKILGISNHQEKKRFQAALKKLNESGLCDPINWVVTNKCLKLIGMTKGTGRLDSQELETRVKGFVDFTSIWKNLYSYLYDSSLSEDENVYRIKLIFVENLRDKKTKDLRKVLGKFIKIGDKIKVDNKATHFGIFHIAIAIGPLQLEWVNCELVMVRKISSNNVVVCLDVGNFHIPKGEKGLRKFCRMTAKEIMNWNRKFVYSSFPALSNEANCQTFVIRMLKFFGIKYSFTGAVEKYVRKLKYGKHAKQIFTWNKKFGKKFDLKKYKNKEFIPNDHADLDKFCNMLFEKCPDFEKKYNTEYLLLKGFDRAWWLKYLANNNNHRSKPLKKTKNDGGCPFSKPNYKLLDEKEEDDDEDSELELILEDEN